MRKIDEIMASMTLEEKAGLCSGKDFWHTKSTERLSVPSVMMSDGPHGLRKQEDGADHLGIHDSIKAVCFPAACATACSFDRALLTEMGELLGEECMAEDVAVLLGPAVNIKRSPLCGRNFEYFSEDPYLAGELASAFVKGVQSRGVGVSVKHFAANNQETRRMSVSSEVSERALREIYFPAFENVVKNADPKTVMCSYNKINGVYASENEWLLTKILRDEWGFDGFVVSDWFAVSDRVRALAAGLDLEMPGGDAKNDELIVAAVRNGLLKEDVLDRAVRNILKVIFDYAEQKRAATFDREKDHCRAVEIAEECAVLLKNNGVLPLIKDKKTLFVGEFARLPRYQGGGSSHINAYRTKGALDFAEGVEYACGFRADGSDDDEAYKQAIAAAAKAEIAVVFAGLPDRYESEGYDRVHMRLPEAQNRLISELCKGKSKVVVVLHNGSPVEMPWINEVDAVLEMYLAGEGGGEACARLLYGDGNPSGKLPETFPLRIEDNPSYLNFPGERTAVRYDEGVFVGYRYYESTAHKVLFPFGYGLSYTNYDYSNLKLSSRMLKAGEVLTVSVDVKNTGARVGKETVQLYVSDLSGEAVRPIRELKGFEKIELAPGETKTVVFFLDKRAFSFFDEANGAWRCPDGKFEIQIGKSCRDIVLKAEILVDSPSLQKITVDDNTTVEELFSSPAARNVLLGLLSKFRPSKTDSNLGDSDRDMMRSAYMQSPLRTVKRALHMTDEQYSGLLSALAATQETN